MRAKTLRINYISYYILMCSSIAIHKFYIENDNAKLLSKIDFAYNRIGKYAKIFLIYYSYLLQ